jgi:hypothetical protein
VLHKESGSEVASAVGLPPLVMIGGRSAACSYVGYDHMVEDLIVVVVDDL